ncbi:MAG: VOC family protein [Eubacteriales bacterium]|nr:VOC family protein [Eubacteriales bacterium]
MKDFNMSDYSGGLQHIGIPTKDMDKTMEFYGLLGFKETYETMNGSSKVVFMALGNLCMEFYEAEDACGKTGAIDHVAIDVNDIEAVYEYVGGLGFESLEKQICFLPFFDKGVRYFTILGPNAEKVEFNQKL